RVPQARACAPARGGRGMGLTQIPDPHDWDDPAPWRVDVEIGEVVLDGFERADRDAVADAFGRELGRLLRRQPARLITDDDAHGGGTGTGDWRVTADLPPAISPVRLGQSLAHVVFRAVGGPPPAEGGPAASVRPIDAGPAGGPGNARAEAHPGRGDPR